eukprot:6469918-Amphidinium_carterae.1
MPLDKYNFVLKPNGRSTRITNNHGTTTRGTNKLWLNKSEPLTDRNFVLLAQLLKSGWFSKAALVLAHELLLPFNSTVLPTNTPKARLPSVHAPGDSRWEWWSACADWGVSSGPSCKYSISNLHGRNLGFEGNAFFAPVLDPKNSNHCKRIKSFQNVMNTANNHGNNR